MALEAQPGQAGEAHALVGVDIQWEVDPDQWEAVKDAPVQVVTHFTYDLAASFTPDNGSANAVLGISPLVDGWYDLRSSGSHHEMVLLTTTVRLEELDHVYFHAYSQAHSAEQDTPGGTVHTSMAHVSVHKIEIRFPPDLIAIQLEVTQAVQDLNHSVRLVAGKRTFVRLHVRSDRDTHHTFARLLAVRDGAPILLDPINPGAHIVVQQEPDRGVRDHAFLFELPDGYRQGTVSLTAVVNPVYPERPQPDPPELRRDNNMALATVTFEPVPPLNLAVHRIGYRANGNNYLPAQVHVDRLISWLGRAYPVHQVANRQYTYDLGEGLPDCVRVNNSLTRKRLFDTIFAVPVPAGTRYYGLVADGGGFMRGCAAGIPSFVASGPAGTQGFAWDTDGSYGDWYGGHELGHTYGRRHVRCRGEAGADPAYPDHPRGRISKEQSGDNAFYGFDIGNHAVYGPNWHDMMTYCANQWIGEHTYEGIMEALQATLPPPPDPGAGSARMLVLGAIYTATAQLDAAFIIPNAPDLKPRVPGPYDLVLRNAAGAELARYPFTPEEGVDDVLREDANNQDDDHLEVKFVAELVPHSAGARRVDLEGPDGLLASIMPGAQSPVVTLLSPNGGEIISDDSVTVSWTASDADGDPLAILIQYSPDNGLTWEVVGQYQAGGGLGPAAVQSIGIDRGNLVVGSEALFRIWVSDGLNTISDQSDASLTLLNAPPTAVVLAPETAATFSSSQTIALIGDAYDPDSGSLDDSQLTWASDLDGSLGQGQSLSVSGLSPGVHTITFQANDGAGGLASDTVNVTVVDHAGLLPPPADRLIVGPDLISFEPAEAIVTATLYLANENPANSLTWQATTDQPWLQLSAGSGQTPQQIVVTFTGIELTSGWHEAAVTFTSTGTPDDSHQINVLVYIPGSYDLYMPLIRH